MKSRRQLLGLFFAAAISVATVVVPNSIAHASTGYPQYTMRLSPTSATVGAGNATSTIVSFDADPHLWGIPANLSVTGLPAGTRASFSPPKPLIHDTSTLTITTAPSSHAGTVTITATAITDGANGVDPIGTSTTFDLTINVP